MFAPLILVVLGIVLLFNTMNVLDWTIWDRVWRLWPLVLIAFGVDVALGRRNRPLANLIIGGLAVVGVASLFFDVGFGYAVLSFGSWISSAVIMVGLVLLFAYLLATRGGFMNTTAKVLQAPLNVPLNGAQAASVRIDFGAGELNIGALQPGSGALAAGTLEYYDNQPEPRVTATPGPNAALHIEAQTPNSFSWPFGGDRVVTAHWNIGLDPQIPTDLAVHTGASKVILDLERLRANRVSLELGASTATVVLPAQAGNTQASVQGGAMTTQLYVPASVEARILVEAGLASVKVDPRFRKQGNQYVSDNYGRGPNNLDLEIHVGAATVEVISR